MESSLTLNRRDWLETVLPSIPEYASTLEKNLVSAMTDNELSTVVSNGCALVAALVSKNPDLALEISMSSALFGNDVREEIAAIVTQLTVSKIEDQGILSMSSCTAGANPEDFGHLSRMDEISGFAYNEYAYAAAIALEMPFYATRYVNLLVDHDGYSPAQAKQMADIVATVCGLSSLILI